MFPVAFPGRRSWRPLAKPLVIEGAVLDAMIAAGKMPPVARGHAGKPLPREFKVAVNTSGTIVLPKEAVADSFRFAQGQAFVARRWGRKIILTLAG